MEVVLLCASINNFVLVNLDRLICLKFQQFPMRSNSSTSSPSYNRIKIGIAICWGLAFIPAAPMWFSTKDVSKMNCPFPFESVSLKKKINTSNPSYFKTTWVWTAASLAFIVPTIAILTIWMMIAVHLRGAVGTGKRNRGRKLFIRTTIIMGTLTTGMI